jgi:hypothetical protein
MLIMKEYEMNFICNVLKEIIIIGAFGCV